LHLNKKIPFDKDNLVSPDLNTVKVLELLCRKKGKYTGRGTNDNYENFTGELTLTPVVNNYGINISYRATGEDGTVLNEEHTLIALDSENRLAMWTLNSNFNTTVIFDFRFHRRIHSTKDIIVFGYGNSDGKELSREEISIEFWDNGDLTYTYFWGMPSGEFMKHTTATMEKVDSR
jgi:hypothetical protein